MGSPELDLEYLCWLCKLELDPEQKSEISRDLPRILEFFDKIQSAQVDHLEPLFHVHELTNIFRPDEPSQSLPQDRVLAGAPRSIKGFFKAPRLI